MGVCLIYSVVFVLSMTVSSARFFHFEHKLFRNIQNSCNALKENESDVRIFLTISSLTLPTARNLELHWSIPSNFKVLENEFVILYQGDPSSRDHTKLDLVRPKEREGFYRSKHTYRTPEMNSDNMRSRCTKYWIAYVRGEVVISKQCLQIAASWMWDNKDSIGKFYPHEIMLPGTHNSGTYKKDRELLFKLVANQDQDIWSQLMYGNRFLDLRIGRSNNRFWIHHDLFPIRPINSLVEDLRLFLEHSREIIFIDIHRFPSGFENQSIHDQLVQYLKEELGSWIKPRTKEMNLKEMWKSGRRLVIAYADRATVAKHHELHPRIYHAWANAHTVADLQSYLADQMKHEHARMWAAMAELTPNIWDFIIPNSGNRDLAQAANTKITKLFRDKWWMKANIVATDFFLGNDIINVAIESNKKRAQCVHF